MSGFLSRYFPMADTSISSVMVLVSVLILVLVFWRVSGSFSKQRFDGEFAAHETRQEKVAGFP